MLRSSPTHIRSRPVAQKPKNGKRLKSSLAARKLIRAAIKRYGSEHKAARQLGLPTQAQLHKMLTGEIGDTPSMKAALVRAEARAQRAFYLVRDAAPVEIDTAAVCSLVDNIEKQLATIKALATCTSGETRKDDHHAQ